MHAGVAIVAEYTIYLVTAVFALVLVRLPKLDRRVLVAQLIVAAVITAAMVELAGFAYHHPRPFADGHVRPWFPHKSDNGFPSDHTAVTGMAAVLLWPYRRGVTVVLTVAALVAGAARVLAHVHWPIDVVAALGIGGTGAAVGLYLGELLVRRRPVTATGASHADDPAQP